MKDKQLKDILSANTDGVFEGNILEFKLNIKDISSCLFQTIKYLSKLRIKGIPIPKNILLISLRDTKIYKYDSGAFLKEIETVYSDLPSKKNQGFITYETYETIDFSTNLGQSKMIEVLRQKEYTKIHINEDCIIGWSDRYYQINPKATKASFLGTKQDSAYSNDGEIRNPKLFKDFIYPYKDDGNTKFKYLMDVLNDKLSKKELGAFFTPLPYCKKAAEMVEEAIKNIPEGHDYIVLDRCSGTGNLLKYFNEEIWKKCIVSTYEYYEYKVLQKEYGDKVKYIIPPTDEQIDFINGKIENANALTEEYISTDIFKPFIENPKINIIMLENPPYRDVSTGINAQTTNKTSFVKKEMGLYFSNKKNQSITNDLVNLFIWSAFKYFLKKPNDSYILFSPVKYFKSLNLVNKTFKDGYLLNKKYFHASASGISLIWWQNIESDKYYEEITLKICDIEKDPLKKDQIQDGQLIFKDNITVKKVYKRLLDSYADKQERLANLPLGTHCEMNGKEITDKKTSVKSYYHPDIVAYLVCHSFSIDPKSVNLLRQTRYDGHGFYLWKDNYFEKLPIFCAKIFFAQKWWEKNVIFATGDGGNKYLKDKDFLKSCFIFTCLSQYNKCRSFNSIRDKHQYQNELCFDEKTLASEKLETLTLSKEEAELINLWKKTLTLAKKTEEFNSEFKYGTYQIIVELNVFEKNEFGEKIYKYVELNSSISNLKEKIKKYYEDQILPKLFKYELLK